MRRKTLVPTIKIAMLITLYAATSGCGGALSSPTFSEPQPADEKALKSFPDRLQGRYIHNDGVSVITISEDHIVRVRDYEMGKLRAELDSSVYISGDELIDKNTGERNKITLRGDSVLIHFHEEDTIASIPAGNVLKKFKGYYFLNYGDKENGWIVQRMALSNGKLITAYVSDSVAIAKLKELAEKPVDTLSQQYSIYSVSKKNFKTLLKSEGFSDEDTFTRIR
jgi:hypothetical protein